MLVHIRWKTKEEKERLNRNKEMLVHSRWKIKEDRKH